ncbi:MAG: polysaccharide deacetylase family protein [Gaiellaceae bacterium]
MERWPEAPGQPFGARALCEGAEWSTIPSVTDKQRASERELRRRRLRRQRQIAALATALLVASVLALALFLFTGDDSPSPAPIRSVATNTPKKMVVAKPVPAKPWLTALAGAINKATHLGETAALDRFAARGKPVYCGGSSGRYVALTFDDGPGTYTPLALKILRQKQVRATFFLIGSNVLSGGSSVRTELGDYAALGVHAWEHKSLDQRSQAKIRNQIVWTRNAIAKATGAQARLFRPPYGARNARVDKVTRRLGMVEVLWSIDSGDSQGKNWRQIGREVLRNIQPGSIVLLHDNRGQTIRALHRLILPGLEKRGLIPVTVPELLTLDPPPVDGPSRLCWVRRHP